MRTGVLMLAMAAALAGAPARAQAPEPAQPPADPIGALLDDVPDEPDEAAERPAGQTPAGRGVVRPPSVPANISDLAYDSRVRASMLSAQGFQGPLDGSWTLAATDGELYALQLADKGRGEVEGAWRDLRRPGATDASGFIDRVERLGPDMTLRFAEGRYVVVLHSTSDGAWRGELLEGQSAKPVTLKRRSP